MEATCSSSEMPEARKATVKKMLHLLPAIIQVITAIAIIVTGCFGEAGIGTPWWSGSVFLISGSSVLILIWMKQTLFWERCAFATTVLSTIVSVLAVILYSLEFALATLPQNPFPHQGISDTRLARHYKIVTALLALTAFNLGICSWILTILRKVKETPKHIKCASDEVDPRQ